MDVFYTGALEYSEHKQVAHLVSSSCVLAVTNKLTLHAHCGVTFLHV